MKYLALALIFVGCSTPQPSPQPREQPIRVIKQPIKPFNGTTSCFSYNRDSITCRSKRIQAILGTLEDNLNNVLAGVGNCDSCGN